MAHFCFLCTSAIPHVLQKGTACFNHAWQSQALPSSLYCSHRRSMRNSKCLHPDRWLLQALEQLSIARRILGCTYVFAYTVFADNSFPEDISAEQNSINQTLFENLQQQLEAEVRAFDEDDVMMSYTWKGGLFPCHVCVLQWLFATYPWQICSCLADALLKHELPVTSRRGGGGRGGWTVSAALWIPPVIGPQHKSDWKRRQHYVQLFAC